eukprot:4585783-Prymnesium_polylepis.1
MACVHPCPRARSVCARVFARRSCPCVVRGGARTQAEDGSGRADGDRARRAKEEAGDVAADAREEVDEQGAAAAVEPLDERADAPQRVAVGHQVVAAAVQEDRSHEPVPLVAVEDGRVHARARHRRRAAGGGLHAEGDEGEQQQRLVHRDCAQRALVEAHHATQPAEGVVDGRDAAPERARLRDREASGAALGARALVAREVACGVEARRLRRLRRLGRGGADGRTAARRRGRTPQGRREGGCK